MAQLIVMMAPDSQMVNKKFTLVGGDTLGSNAANSIVLNSESVQPHHAIIKVMSNGIYMSSINEAPVLLNGSSTSKCNLGRGDMITIGDYTLLFDDQVVVEKPPSPTAVESSCVQSQIKVRKKHYDDPRHILQDLGHIDKSHGRLITLYKIANAISGILDLDQLLQRFLEIILDEFPADRAFIMLIDEKTQKPIPRATFAKNRKHLTQESSVSQSIIEEVMSTKESLLCENIMQDDRFKPQDSLVQQNIMSVMCVPLIRQDQVLGLIHLDSSRDSLFTDKDLDLLTKVAMQAAMVIENARNYQERQNFNRNLLALSHATQSLSSYLREDLIVEEAAQYASRIFSCDKSYLMIRKSSEEHQLAYAVGITSEQQEKFNITKSFAKVIENNQSLVIQSKKQIPPDLLPLVEEEYLSDSLVIVPISRTLENFGNSKPAMGALCVSFRKDQMPFNQTDAQLLTILASYTAIAVSNARFYQDLKNKEEEIARWNMELEKKVEERTERIEAMQGQLVQSEKMAAVGLLAAGVSHEFNNIIASMYGFAQIAKKNDKYKDKLVDVVINQSKRACDITESLLSFSKMRGEVEELIEVSEMVEHVLQLTMSALENEGIEIIKEYNEVPRTCANPNKIQQVFLNIIINGRHAIEEPTGTITIRTFLKDEKIYVSFTDNGKGISEENKNRIFEPFYTTKGSFGGGTQPGTGIGLSLCYNIVRMLDGDILVESELGKGSTFTVILPVRTSVRATRVQETRKRLPTIYLGQRILVVEDTSDIKELLTRVLEEKGFEVHAVDNGGDALELCKKEKFDIVFLDIRMPGVVDGFGVFDEVKRMEPNTKVILLTGRAEDSNLMNYVGRADGYLRKPFNIDDIYRILDTTTGGMLTEGEAELESEAEPKPEPESEVDVEAEGEAEPEGELES